MHPASSAAGGILQDEGIPREDAVLLERLLAEGRLILSMGIAVLVSIDRRPPDPSNIGYWLLIAYVLFAANVSAWLRRAQGEILRWRTRIHVVDLAAAAFMIAVPSGPHATATVLFLFAILGAALRWGTAATLVTGGFVVAAYLGGGLSAPSAANADHLVLFIRGGFLMLSATVVALVVGEQGRQRSEDHMLSRVLARVKRGDRFTETLEFLFGECLRYLSSPRALMAMHDEDGRLYLWRARSDARSRGTELTLTQLPPAAVPDYFYDMAAQAVVWHASRRRDGTVRVRTLEATGRLGVEQLDPSAQAGLLDRESAASCIVLRSDVANWRVRLFVFDPAERSGVHLRFLRRFSVYVGAPLHSQYLMARLRARVLDVERARIARELHDGLVQSLIGLEMEIDAMRRRVDSSALEDEFAGLRDRLHRSILDTRDLMAELRPPVIGRDGLLGAVAGVVDRFRMETSIDVRFSSEVDELDCAPRTTMEVARIVQEALVNVRKHAAAQHVVVRLGRGDDGWRLTIDDDGRGFGFGGRLSHEDLESQRRGPVVIKERVRAIGGELIVDSEPGRGARLEIKWPFHRRHGSHEWPQWRESAERDRQSI